MQKLNLLILLVVFHVSLLQLVVFSWGLTPKTPKSNNNDSPLLTPPVYHMGPVLTLQIQINIIWYGAKWKSTQKTIIKDFIASFSSPYSSTTGQPRVSDWWAPLADYTDQTDSSITRSIKLTGEFQDSNYSHGNKLSRLSMQRIIKHAVNRSTPQRLPLNYTNGLYLILTSQEVIVEDFCKAVCGFHYFTFPSVVGVTVPYAWVGYSGTQCPDYCAYPFARSKMGPRLPLMGPPNGDVGLDGMISVIAHELAEVSSNPLINGWYSGDDPIAPNEIADMCISIYGKGAGGGFPGLVYNDSKGNAYNLIGVKGRKFLVQWVWNLVKKMCYGPNF